MRALFQKTLAGVLAPADCIAVELLGKLKLGQPVWLDLVRARNTAFHRKYFALLGVGFEAWEPPEIQDGPYAGMVPEKNFDTFRKDITKLAGFVEVRVSVTGEAIVEARSVSFDKMNQDDFERLFSATINVLLRLVLRGKTEAELREWVDAVLRFD